MNSKFNDYRIKDQILKALDDLNFIENQEYK